MAKKLENRVGSLGAGTDDKAGRDTSKMVCPGTPSGARTRMPPKNANACPATSESIEIAGPFHAWLFGYWTITESTITNKR